MCCTACFPQGQAQLSSIRTLAKPKETTGQNHDLPGTILEDPQWLPCSCPQPQYLVQYGRYGAADSALFLGTVWTKFGFVLLSRAIVLPSLIFHSLPPHCPGSRSKGWGRGTPSLTTSNAASQHHQDHPSKPVSAALWAAESEEEEEKERELQNDPQRPAAIG